MRKLASPAYFVRQALADLGRYPLYSTVGVLTLAVSLILAGFLGLFIWRAADILARLSGGMKLTVYLDREVSRSAADELITVIREQWPQVTSVGYHTEVEDKTRNLKLLPIELVEELDPDLIPAQPYLEVSLDLGRLDDGKVEALVKWFSSLDRVQGVDEVLLGAQKISVAFSVLAGAKSVGAFVSLVILLAALFFVLTTTRLIVEGRKREIQILLLVGATRNFVRIPHFIEGALQGVAAGGLAFAVVWMLQRYMMGTLRTQALLQVPLDLLPPGMVVWFVGGGVLLGLAGSALAVSRHMRLTP
jgi:cell division transport system permease protein